MYGLHLFPIHLVQYIDVGDKVANSSTCSDCLQKTITHHLIPHPLMANWFNFQSEFEHDAGQAHCHMTNEDKSFKQSHSNTVTEMTDFCLKDLCQLIQTTISNNKQYFNNTVSYAFVAFG